MQTIIKQYFSNGYLLHEYELLKENFDIRHGYHKRYYDKSELLWYQTNYKNDIEHGECKFYKMDGSYWYSLWYFEGEEVSKEKFERCNLISNFNLN